MPYYLKCKVARIADDLTDGDRRIYWQVMRDSDNWPAKRLERELIYRGIRISNDTIMAHREDLCCCPKEKV